MPSVFIHTAPGFEDYTFHLVNALADLTRVGYLIDVRQKERFGEALHHAIITVPFHRPRRRHVWGVWEMFRASRAIKQFNPDIFHLQGNGLWENLLLRMLGKLPVVNTVHDPILHIDYRNFLNSTFLTDAVQKADGWVVHSEGLKQVLLSQFSVNADRILVHPLGIHDYYCRFAPPNVPREKSILFFGEPRINKGFDLLIKAFANIRDDLKDWKLILAGKGSISPELVATIHRLGDQVIFQNRHMTDAEVAALFSRAGIVALPYRHGSQSGVLGIAAAFGCPVLATPVGNMAEIMQDGKHAYFVEPDSERSLVQGLLRLANHGALRRELGTRLKELANSHWAWKDIARQTVEFYTTILSLQRLQ